MMAHSLILGMTESGKTTLAKRVCSGLTARGYSTIVLDPMHDQWECGFSTDNADEFLEVFWDSKSCHVFIDESGDSVGRFNNLMNQTATKGRHWGHSCYYITQRGAQISRTIRDQCSHLFLFATARPDAKVHALEWNKSELENVATFQAGEYFHATRFGALERGNIFTTINKE